MLDGNSQPITGAKKYTLTLKPPMAYANPVPPGFWSVTMFDRRTGYTAPNPINRYHLADYDKLTKNADGSITICPQLRAGCLGLCRAEGSRDLPGAAGVMPVGGK